MKISVLLKEELYADKSFIYFSFSHLLARSAKSSLSFSSSSVQSQSQSTRGVEFDDSGDDDDDDDHKEKVNFNSNLKSSLGFFPLGSWLLHVCICVSPPTPDTEQPFQSYHSPLQEIESLHLRRCYNVVTVEPQRAWRQVPSRDGNSMDHVAYVGSPSLVICDHLPWRGLHLSDVQKINGSVYCD